MTDLRQPGRVESIRCARRLHASDNRQHTLLASRHNRGAIPADDSTDFILQANYKDCAGFMTFGPGTVYGPDGSGAAGAYYALTYIGIFVTIAVLIGVGRLREQAAGQIRPRRERSQRA